MLTLQNAALAIALLLFAWYFAGMYVNRRRADVLIRHLREALLTAGKNLTIRWFGRSAFQITVGEPRSPLIGLQALCLLEPRDFALALAWSRLRGRRDQVLIGAAYVTPPTAVVSHPLSGYGIAGLTGLEVRGEAPHLQLTLQVGAGGEAAIGQAVELVRHLSAKKRALS